MSLRVAILKEITDAVLRMTWNMIGFDFNPIADRKCLAVTWCFRNLGAIFAANDWNGERISAKLRSK